VVHTVDLSTSGLTSLAQLATKNYTYNYTYNGVGAVNINVTVKGNLNGVEKVYKDVLKLNYKDPAMVTNVIVDGSHFNDYVTGYYGANMNNLTQIAAEDDVKVKIVKDQFNQDTLANCNLLIISAPARKTGTGNAGAFTPSSFDDDFIALVKAYVDQGGDVIVCGLADYQDAATGQSSKEINKLLQAIGATTTINSDEMYDTDNNGGQAYRLYLKSYNKDTPFTSNISDEQTFSSYSGCTVALNTTAVANGSAMALVKGHSTTYSIDTKDNAGATITGSPVVVNKGDVVSLAKETLPSGANVFVAGNVFMSDFEVKAELDNIWSLPYANRTIIENIMSENKTSIEVSSISDVRKGNLGSVYSVEGYVTAGTSVAGNTFFDTIYLQDATGGIDIFPISTSGIALGTKMKIVGTLDQYQGDTELRVISSQVLNDTPKVVEPTEISTKDASNYESYGGMLVKVEGTVTQIQKDSGIVTQILVKDDSGENAKVFIDGYINSATTGQNTLATSIKEEDKISAVGIVYNHPEGTSNTPVTVLRVRNCDEITVTTTSTGVVEIPSYHVSFASQGGSEVTSQTIKQGEKAVIPGMPTKQGYTFAGWFKEDACNNPWDFNSDTIIQDTTLYAKWRENKVTQITLDDTSLTIGKGTTYSLQLSITPTDALNSSVSWSSSDTNVVKVDSSGMLTGVTYGSAIITAKSMDGSDLESSCKVTVGYKINYKLNNGINSSENPSSFYQEKVKLKDPARQGYLFKGWYKDSKFKTKLSTISKSTKKDVTVYAKWEKVTVKQASFKSLSKGRAGSLKVKVNKLSKVSGYEVVYATDKNFAKDSTTAAITGTSSTISGLLSRNTYYVKARAYKVDSTGSKIYGKFSKVKKITIK
jgi:uncharacterized repeat protein (TIGR02543 family)